MGISFKNLCVAVAILVITSCQKESNINPEPTATETQSRASFTIPTTTSSECCVAAPEHQFANLLHENGPNNGVDVGDIEVWNDNASVYVKVTTSCEYDALQCYIGNCATMPTASSGYPNYVDPVGKVTEYTYVFANVYQSCSEICVGARVNGMSGQGACIGGIASGHLSHIIKDICEQGCQPEFIGQTVACGVNREANYIYRSATTTHVKIQGGLTNFTGADAIVTVTGGSNVVIDQWTPGSSSNRVIRVNADVEACEELHINIKWHSTNLNDIITGQWSASGNSGYSGLVDPLSCLAIN
jgi:hypothetical protein